MSKKRHDLPDDGLAWVSLESPDDLLRLSDDEAFRIFKEIRWSGGDPVCPKCGALEHYWLGTRKQWRCKSCNHTFSITSGTVFHGHKMTLRTCLATIPFFAETWSPIRTSKKFDVQYRSAWALAKKLRAEFGITIKLPPWLEAP